MSPMSQRQPNSFQPRFGEQSLAALQAQFCERLPLGCFGTNVNDSFLWQLLCYASARRTTLEQTARMLADTPSANRGREQLRAVLPVSQPVPLHVALRLRAAPQSR